MSSLSIIRNLIRAALGSAVVFGLAAILIGGAEAAQRICDDGTRPPCNDGGGGGSEPPDFGDLIILLRDASGVPILDGNQCQQPIAFPSDLCPVECVENEPCLVPTDPTTCAIQIGYTACTQETDFGRTNLARSSDAVFDSQLDDVLINLATADCISQDPAGRLVTSTVSDEGVVSSSTIDSPLQNLAMYKALMSTGTLGLPLPEGIDRFDTAARAIGVASDKSGGVDVDLVAYLNHIMGLSDFDTATVLPKICINVKEEVAGSVQMVQKCFLDYGQIPETGGPYAYERELNFGALPAPAYIGAPDEGWFEYLELVPGSDPPEFTIVQGPVLNAVFPDGLGGYELGFTDGNIGGFAAAADDTRAVIEFMHNWAVPGEFATPLPCDAIPGPGNYDLSISETSGLQVPVQMIADSEGREFIVTIANAGPYVASGTFTVTAVPAAGGPVIGSPWVYEFDGLAPGMTASATEIFTIGEPYQRTTITWTASIVAEDDINPSNNSVTATTNVRVTNGGKGSH